MLLIIFLMATPIREACLDENDRPTANAARVETALNGKGCHRCHAKVKFDALTTTLHSRPAYDKLYAKCVFKVIGDIEREDTQQQEQARYAQRKAKEEAALLDTDGPTTTHPRPEGRAPEGKTWSFALGCWQDEGWLASAGKKRKRGTVHQR